MESEQCHHSETGVMSLLCPIRAMSSLRNRNHVTSVSFQSNVITQKQESCHFYVLSEQCHHPKTGIMPLLCPFRAMSSLRNSNRITSMSFHSNVITQKQESCHFYVLGHFFGFPSVAFQIFLLQQSNSISTSPFLLCSTQEVFVIQAFQINIIFINYHKV